MPYASFTVANTTHEREHVGGGRAARVDDEVRVNIGDRRAANRCTLQTQRLDQAARGVTLGIDEDAARARQRRAAASACAA